MTLAKPERGSGKAERYHRRILRRAAQAKAERKVKLAELETEKARRLQCFLRDRRRCRATGQSLNLTSDSPLKIGHCHHIVFRSQGGSDELHNRCMLSAQAHADVHAGLIHIEGDGNGTLKFTRKNLETGVIIHTWESTC